MVMEISAFGDAAAALPARDADPRRKGRGSSSP
jgi:hypothetical protein